MFMIPFLGRGLNVRMSKIIPKHRSPQILLRTVRHLYSIFLSGGTSGGERRNLVKYPEESSQVSKMKRLVKIVNGF